MNRLSLLVELASALAREVDLDAWLASAAGALAQAMDAERASLWLVDAEEGDLVTRVAVLPEVPALRQKIGVGIAGAVARGGLVLRIDDAGGDPRFDPSADRVTGFQTRTILAAPIREDASAPVRGVVQVLNKRGGATFDGEDAAYLEVLGRELGRALALTTLKPDDARGPGLTLRGPFNRIVGRGAAMESVYERIGLAAQTDATVLLRGETGTGKSLFARAIHVNSPRRDGPFVTVDCTTLPPQLVESELFGHERGAFTGAERRVRGRVEMASGGTLFLDEIGDLPIEIQGKLLRFLQDRVFERVGGRETHHADVRILCATHHDLEQAAASGRFREDLYYRVRVLEIDVPRLVERGPEEVERLARHFADLYAKKYRRPDPSFDDDALEVLRGHVWPGNVRELEHWIESAIVLAPDGVIRRSKLPTIRGVARATSERETGRDGFRIAADLKLDDAVRAYIEATVRALGGNRSEAARRLGVSRNTIARALRGR
jgi:DNA-binding NtrC family response regulator